MMIIDFIKFLFLPIEKKKCPICKSKMRFVGESRPGLNFDIWNTVKAGDYFCKKCKRYF